MPLRKVDDPPKIPKTRKKKAESVLKAIPAPKPDKVEYICKLYFKYDKTEKKQYLIIRVETAAYFTSFKYEITYDLIEKENDIYIIITGLKARMDLVPEVGPASCELRKDIVEGNIKINLAKQDGAINGAEYKLDFNNRKIELIKEFMPPKKNNRVFSKFEVDNDNFSFAD
ncbi:MAG: hypothetical protein ACOYVE_14515 [Melioribacter sp.]|jgi:hypothetical protein|uniref:hypothetical protein n=1 Tax=Melioribacter sp. TaxID=2052167 RepID=UPI003BDDC656